MSKIAQVALEFGELTQSEESSSSLLSIYILRLMLTKHT